MRIDVSTIRTNRHETGNAEKPEKLETHFREYIVARKNVLVCVMESCLNVAGMS